MAVEQDQSPTDVVAPAMPLGVAALLHAGVLGICALAVYSTHVEGPIDWAETHPDGNPILAAIVALVVLIPIIGLRARLAERPFGKLVLALGLAYTFRLVFRPLMPASLLGDVAETYQISWANAGVLILLIGWLACLVSRGRASLGFTGLEAPVAVSALGLCALVIVLLLSVGKHYDADASYAIAFVIKAVQYGFICIIAITVSGARRIGAWLHIYLFIALAAAVAISMLAAGEPMDAHHSVWRALV